MPYETLERNEMLLGNFIVRCAASHRHLNAELRISDPFRTLATITHFHRIAQPPSGSAKRLSRRSENYFINLNFIVSRKTTDLIIVSCRRHRVYILIIIQRQALLRLNAISRWCNMRRVVHEPRRQRHSMQNRIERFVANVCVRVWRLCHLLPYMEVHPG